jgi:cytosine/uracil/thiamine/allantoin permease
VLIGVVPVIPGFLHAATTKGGVVADPNFLDQLYRYGVFVAFGLAAVSYYAMSVTQTRGAPATAMAE